MCELTLNGLSVHYIVDHSVPCQLWCLVAFGIYDIFPNFLTLLLVLVRGWNTRNSSFWGSFVTCPEGEYVSVSVIWRRVRVRYLKWEYCIISGFLFNGSFHWDCCQDWSLQCLKNSWYFLICSPFLELKTCLYSSEPPSYYFEHDEPKCVLLHRYKSNMIPLGWIKSFLI